MSTFDRAPRMTGLSAGDLPQYKYKNVAPMSPTQARQQADSAGAVDDATRRAQAEAAARSHARGNNPEEVKKLLGSHTIRAKYKIQVFYGPNRTLKGPNVTEVRIFESGTKLHGGGDDLMFICRNPQNEAEGCGSFIMPDAIHGPVAMCPGCQKLINASKLSEFLVANFSTERLSIELAKIWRQLGGSADIYCKYDRTDIRYIAIEKKYGSAKARELRGKHIYPLRNILVDTSNGASLEKRIFAFLTA